MYSGCTTAVETRALIQLALRALSCSQKTLALRLGVSPAQITKWKSGGYMSKKMKGKIRDLVHIGDEDPQFVFWAGSVDAARKWGKLIYFLAREAGENSQSGYDTKPLRGELSLLCWQTFYTLEKMGVEFPATFPNELDVDYEDCLDSAGLWDRIEENPYSSLIYKMYESLTNVYGFYAAYVSALLFDEDLRLMETEAEHIEPCLLDLAASKIAIHDLRSLATKFREFRYQVNSDYNKWLNIVKERAFRVGVPLRAELLHMVYESDESLCNEAESESLGLNSSRLHPDLYMDELLRGMRVIHQVLPAMMKKLGINDFKLEKSELLIDSPECVFR